MAPTPGRPPLERNVVSFEYSTLLMPGEVVLDTSFVVSALVRTEKDHAACQSFMVVSRKRAPPTDAGFGDVPASVLRLYVDSSRVRSCRRRRGGR